MAWTAGRSVEPHRLDPQDQRRSRDHADLPASAARRRAAASRTRARGRRGRPRRRRRSRAAPSRMQRGGQPGPGGLAAVERVGRGAPVEVDRDERSSSAEVRLVAGRQQRGAWSAADQRPIGRAGRQQQDARRRTAAPAASSASAVEMPTIGSPSPWARPLAVAMPDPQPGERARAGPDDDRRQARPARRLLAEELADGGQQRLAVAVAGRPVGRAVEPARRACRSPRRPGVVALSMARMTAAPPVCEPVIATASR